MTRTNDRAKPKRAQAGGFNPVPHTVQDTATAVRKPAVKTAYDASGDEYAALRAILSARTEAGLTQAEVAARMGTTASAVSRLEASLASEKHSPSLATLRKYAVACGKRLVISFA